MSAPLSYKNDNDADERLNPTSDNARRLRDRENESLPDELPGYDRNSDGLDDHPITAGDASGESGSLSNGDNKKNIDNVNEKEQDGGGWKTSYAGTGGGKPKKITGKFSIRKGGPAGLLATISLIAGMLGFSGIPLMGISTVESVTNDKNDAGPTQKKNALETIGGKIGNSKEKEQETARACKVSSSFNCRLKTFAENTVTRAEANKFSLGDKKKIGDRISFSSFKFPDGKVASSGDEFNTHVRDSPEAGSNFKSIYDIRNSLYVDGNWFSKVLGKMGLDKTKKIKGNSKDATDKSFEESTKNNKEGGISTKGNANEANENATEEEKKQATALSASNNETAQEINTAIKEGKKLETLKLKSGGAALIQLPCLTYSMANFLAISGKTVKMARYATFAMIILSLIASVKAGKATEAEVNKGMSIVAPSSYPETVPDPNDPTKMIPNPDIGKNMTDGEMVKVVMQGDTINFSDAVKSLFVAGGFLGVLDKVISMMNQSVPGGKATIKTTCRIANSSLGNIVGFIAAPVLGAIMATVVAVFPIEEWAADLVNVAIEAAAGLDLTTGITGPTAGNVLVIGTGAIMSTAAMRYGMRPGKFAAVKQNMMANAEDQRQEIAIKQYEAKRTPLAITNRYSFLGSMAYGFSKYMPTAVGQQPLLQSAGKVLSAIPMSLSSVVKTAGASYTMPVAGYTETRFGQCEDDRYKEMSNFFDPDMGCGLRMVSYGDTTAAKAIAYAKDNNQITDPDTTNADPIPGSDYEKFIKHCSQEREDPWGSTSVAPEDETDGSGWYTGEECLKPENAEKMTNFSKLMGLKISQENIDADPTKAPEGGGGSGGGAQTSAATPEMCKTLPADDLGQIACHGYQFDSYGYLWGGGHSGTAAEFMAKFKAGGFTSGVDHILDCSGLVRMAIFDATGVDIGGMPTGSFPSYAKFQEVAKADAKAGDILWKTNPGHTEIVVSNDTAAQKWQTVGAHEATADINKDIGPTTYSYSGFEKVFRFVK
ncbi:MAG TPA: hypothetical protein VK502_00120 [Candidatus Saccharimonadales bacterium]|nr:hypothetical protein [Candidatus Saccharimonadales bacterium]